MVLKLNPLKIKTSQFLINICLLLVGVRLFAQPPVSSLPALNNVDYLSAILDLSMRFDTTSAPGLTPVVADPAEAWKYWNTVENFAYGKDRGNLSMIIDLKALHPYFRDRITQLMALCKEKGIELAVVESYRTRSKQAEYFSMGRKYTRSAGGKSKHQYGLAVDLVPIINGEAQWDDKVLWKKIGVIGESLGLRWGGRWRSPYDPAHFEWTGGLATSELTTGVFPSVPDTAHYPCLHEDLEQLKKSWTAWESTQSAMAKSVSINAAEAKADNHQQHAATGN